jgi:hypothetical protein
LRSGPLQTGLKHATPILIHVKEAAIRVVIGDDYEDLRSA